MCLCNINGKNELFRVLTW